MTEEKKEVNVDEILAKLTALEERTAKQEEDNARLKAHAEQLIEEKRQQKAKDKAEIERLAKEALNAKASTQEEAENIAKQWREKAEAAEKAIAERDSRDRMRQLQDEALRIAQTKAAKDPNRAKLLAEQLMKNLRLDDEGKLVVTDDKGNTTISPVDELVNRVSTNYSFLVDGLDSSGGGMHSNAAKPTKSFSEMTTAEKNTLYLESPEKYEQAKLQG